MKKSILTLFICLLVVFGSSWAQSTDQSKPIPMNPDVRTGTLPNGLKYYIRYNKLPENKVELRLAVNAGSVLEDQGQEGLAHFMEHMNFNGLEHFPANEIVQYLRSIGVAFGNDLNAYTGFDETVYILPVPGDQPGKLDSAFMILADWSGAALLTSEEIDKERGVILAESKIGKGADDRMMKIWLPEMLNGSKYAERLPIGLDSILETFDHSVLRKFYHDWYRPNNQAVIVVGDIPVDKAEKMIIEKFSKFKNPEPSRERPELFEVLPYAQNKAMVLSDPEAAYTAITINGSPRPEKQVITEADYFNNQVISLCNRMLNARLDELRTLAEPPFVYAYAYNGGFTRGYENFTAVAMCGSTEIQKATEALVTETIRVKQHGFTQSELDRAKAQTLSLFEKNYNERDKDKSGNLTWELVSNFFVGDAIPSVEWKYNFIKANLDRITLATLADAYAKMDIDEKYFAMVTAKTQPGLPTDDQFKSWIDGALQQKVAPYTEKVLAATLLEKEPVAGTIVKREKNEKLGTTTFTLSNQTVVCIRPTDFKNDEVLLKGSRFGGHSLYEGADYQSAQWCNNVVDDMGYGEFSSADLNKFLAGKTVRLYPAVVEYTEYIDGNSTVKDMETLFQLLYLKCTSPRRDEAAFQSFVTRSKQSVESQKQDPQYLFMDTAYNTLFQGHPMAHMIYNGEDYDKIQIDNAISFYNQRIGNQAGMYYTIVGSFTEEQIVPLIEKYIGGMPAGPINTQYKDLGLFPVQGKNNFTLRKGSEEKAMLMHYITGKAPYNVDDQFMLENLNKVINNKITDQIREKMSAIYGGGLNGSLKKYPREEFMVRSSFPCAPDNIVAVDTAFMAILERVKAPGGITASDLQKVREPAIEHNKVNLKENRYWLNYLQNAHLNGTDPERLLKTEQMLKELKEDQLIQTAKKYYSGPNLFKAEWLPEVVN